MKKIFTITAIIMLLISCDMIETLPERIVLDEKATYEEVYNAVATPLKQGETKLKLTLPAEPSDQMFKAIRRALLETEEVADGSIDMTLHGVNVIGENAFGYHADLNNESVYELKSVTLPDAVEIKRYAFFDCRELCSFYAPKAKTIGVNAFVLCEKLTQIDLPKAEIIQRGALQKARELTRICLPELRTISAGMFGGCDRLETVVLPKVTRIEERAFEACMDLKTIVFASPIESIDREVFYTHDEQNNHNTAHVDLVLSSQQRRMISTSDDDSTPNAGMWHASGERFDFHDDEFAGYRFNSIRPYEEYESNNTGF